MIGRRVASPGVQERLCTSGIGPAAITEYFDAIDSEDAVRAADCFTEDTVVATPPAGDERDIRVVRRGRRELARAFAERGPVTWRHRLADVYKVSPVSVVEGDLVDLATDSVLSSFLVLVEADRHGKIARFRSYRRADRPARTTQHSEAGPWLSLLQEFAATTAESGWLAGGFAADATCSLPPSPLPEWSPAGLVIEVGAGNEAHAVLHGRIDDSAEFCVVARRSDDQRVGGLIAYWCRLPERGRESRKGMPAA
jgi:ketosteroid isomerase-like protein